VPKVTKIRMIELDAADLVPTDKSLIRSWSRHRRIGESRAPSTVIIGERYVTRWALWLAERGKHLMDARPEDALDFAELWQRWGWSASQRTHLLSILRGFYDYLCTHHHAPLNPWCVLRHPPRRYRLPNIITPPEFDRLAQQFCRPTWRDMRDRAVLEFLWSTACRVGGLCSLDMDKLDLVQRRAIVREKGDRDRVVFLTPRCVKYLRIYIDNARPLIARDNKAVFVGQHGERILPAIVRDIVARAALGARLGRHVTPHTIRHSVATMMRRNRADLREIQGILGHQRISTTELYTHLDASDLANAHRRFHPDGDRAA
jgi:site-specific recombinase XerD